MTNTTTRRWSFRLAVVVLVLAVLGAVAAGWWYFVGSSQQTIRRAAAAAAEYLADCRSASPSDAVGVLTLPGGTGWLIQPGADASLSGAIGWYTQTALPGQVGNMAVVGQHLKSGGPFDSILSIDVGDHIVVDTCDASYTYTVRVAPRDLAIQSTDTWVLDAVPGQPGTMPTSSWLTLIANQDVLQSSRRVVGFAELTATAPK